MQHGFHFKKEGIEDGKDRFSPWAGTDPRLDIS